MVNNIMTEIAMLLHNRALLRRPWSRSKDTNLAYYALIWAVNSVVLTFWSLHKLRIYSIPLFTLQ